MSRTRLQKILNKLDNTNEGTLGAIRDFESGVKALREKLQKEIQANTLDEVNLKINKFRKELDLKPLLDSLNNLEEAFKESALSLLNELEDKSTEFKNLSSKGEQDFKSRSQSLSEEITKLNEKIEGVSSSGIKSVAFISDRLSSLKELTSSFNDVFSKKEEVSKIEKDIKKIIDDLSKSKEEDIKINDTINSLRIDFMSRLANKGGGNANRNIAIGGNTSVLSKFTDINFKPGSNVTLTYSNNNTTKYTDITISATGGSGTSRVIERTAVSSTVGGVTGTDYIVIATGGVQLTLPTAVSNTNLYTIKNVANSSVLIGTTGGQTIDGDTTLILATQYTAVDIINDGNDNWSIT